MSEKRPKRISRPLKLAGAVALAAGLSGGIVVAEHGSSNNSPAGPSLANELKHPLNPLYAEASPNGARVPAGQQPPVGEVLSPVPGHKHEVRVQFASEPNGVIPPTEAVHGTIPVPKPGEGSPLLNVDIPVQDIRFTPGAPNKPPTNN